MYLTFKRDVAVIVDGYSSGTQIAPAFRAKGIICVHVRSEADVTPDYATTFKPQDFIEDILFEDIQSLRDRLVHCNVRWVLPGSELGVGLAARLADVFQTECRNDENMAECWRNKYSMHEALKRAGVRSIPHFLTQDCEAMVCWADTVAGYPVVIKPKASSGTDNIHICHTPDEVRHGFDCIMGQLDAFLHRNNDVLGQVFLRNEEFGSPGMGGAGFDVEYCVNTVSLNGTHFVNDVIKVYRRRVGDNPVHDYNELLCPVANATEYKVFGAYIGQVLDALGICNGPAHSELMVVNGEPVLLETGARMPGSNDMSAYSKALGFAQVELWMLACTNPQAFIDFIAQPRTPLRHHSSCVFLISDAKGQIVNPPDIGPWLALPDLHSITLQQEGQITRTADLNNVPGYVFILARDKADLPAQRKALRDSEQAIYKSMLDPHYIQARKFA